MKLFKTMVIVMLTITIFLISAYMIITYGKTNNYVLWGLVVYLIIANIYGFFIMIFDKQKSKHSNNRVSERHLFIASALGGSLGTLMGMIVGKHKTKHFHFRLFFPILFIIEGLFIFYFYYISVI